MIFQVILASEFPKNTPLDFRRIQYIFPKETIIEMNHQVELLGYMNKNLEVLLQTPAKKFIEEGSSNKRKIKKDLLKVNGIIGKLLSTSLEQNIELGVLQLKGIIEIIEDDAVETIQGNKKELCFFPLISYSPVKSLKKLDIVDNDVFEVHMPFKIIGIALGTTRQSANPYLQIL